MTLMTVRTAALGLGLLAAGPAAALSCLRPDVANAYRMAAEAEEAYVVLLGEFTFAPSQQPQTTGDINAPEPAPPVPAGFSGKSLSAEGFSRDFAGEVTLEPECLAAWCGGFPEPGEALAFVLKEGESYRLVLGPCGGTHFPVPTPEQIARVEACHAGGDCAPADD